MTTQGIRPFSEQIRDIAETPTTAELEISIFVQPDVALHQSLKLTQFIATRCVDVLGAGAAFFFTAPLWLLIGVAIVLDSPGPVFFRQERVGLGGRRFRMLKFRTMRYGADEEKSSVAHLNVSGDDRLFKIPNDPRVSRVGGGV